MITPRTTRLIRVADLGAFRAALAGLACQGPPLAARDRLILVPSRAAAEQLRRSFEDRQLASRPTLVLPDLVPVGELVTALAQRLVDLPPVLSEAEREALLGAACRTARSEGFEPPFRLRPGLVTEMLRFYDTLRLNQKTVDVFERLALGQLEPGAAYDRGAERLVRQTRFLTAAFRAFEARCREVGVDQHGVTERLLATAARTPYRHVVVAVGDRAFDPNGLAPAHWDLLSRVAGLEQLDVVATDRVVAGEFHEVIHRLLPGIEEIRLDGEPAPEPRLCVPSGGDVIHRPRDREDEVSDFARRVKAAVRSGQLRVPARAAIVVHQRLPYVYVAREVFRSAGVPCQMFDALPLAAEPFAAALDVVLSAVGSNFARGPAAALLRSPHLDLGVTPRDADGLDRALAEQSYLGDPAALARLVDAWEQVADERGKMTRAARAGRVLLRAAAELAPLQDRRPVAGHLDTLLAFLTAHAAPGAGLKTGGYDDTLRDRHLRARAAVLATLAGLRDAFARFDTEPVSFHDVRALVRRWIDAQTFAPRTGDGGVHVVDSASAPFGEFDLVQLAGLVEGEWPEPPRRDIFYSPAVLRELGWPAEQARLDGARAAFGDLVTLPAQRLVASAFLLEADTIVSPSPFVEDIAAAGYTRVEEPLQPRRIFDHEALATGTPRPDALDGAAAAWAALRIEAPAGEGVGYHGRAGATAPRPLSLSALERYLDCPFKFFAADVLRLEEPPEDDAAVSPRARGRFVHEALQHFFEAWDREGVGPITPGNLGRARTVFAAAVEPLLARLSQTDAAHERARLFGSAISPGVAETVLSLEASRPPEPVSERWLEYRLEGDFTLGGEAPGVALRGMADRIDLLPGKRLRVIDYKSGSAPQPKLALQAPVYALCAQERLSSRDGAAWRVDEAAYVSLRGPRTLVPIVKAGSHDDERLAEARDRVLEVLANVGAGEFPPRPQDEMSCRWCAYASVCRKDYVGDE